MTTSTLILLFIALLTGGAALFLGLALSKARQQAVATRDARILAEEEARVIREKATQEVARETEKALSQAQRQADALLKEAELKAKEQALAARQEAELKAKERQGALEKQEQRLQSKEDGLDKKLQQVEQKSKDLETQSEKRKAELEKLAAQQAEAAALVEAQHQKLEQIAGLTREDAKAEITSQLEYTAKMDAAKLIRRIEEEATEEAVKRARWTIGASTSSLSAAGMPPSGDRGSDRGS